MALHKGSASVGKIALQTAARLTSGLPLSTGGILGVGLGLGLAVAPGVALGVAGADVGVGLGVAVGFGLLSGDWLGAAEGVKVGLALGLAVGAALGALVVPLRAGLLSPQAAVLKTIRASSIFRPIRYTELSLRWAKSITAFCHFTPPCAACFPDIG